ncbi:MAG: adenosine kinase [Peltula sp. TS41687]|nr:MAG: adenosine kinase [Peltula sp. TS41687]
MECMREEIKKGAILDGRYEIQSPLNRGTYGVVILAKDLETGERVAIKCLTKASASDDESTSVTEGDQNWELQCHKLLAGHPGIVQMHRSFESEAHVFLVLEFCSNGDLYEAIFSNKGPSETERVRSLMLQLVDCVEFMHSKGLYHRDIKPENILLTHNGDLKLGDFGLATQEEWSFHGGVGTERYMAPEQYETSETGYSTAKADIWAVGITLISVIFGRNLFECPADSDVHFTDYVRNSESLFDKFPTMTVDTFQVLSHALTIDPEQRSLEAFRTALTHVDNFTTDDEEDDFFCIGDREIVPVNANRQPLPTPSIKKEINEDFWTKLLRRQLPPLPVPEVLEEFRDAEAVPELETCREGPASDDANPSSLATVSLIVETPSVGIVGDSSLGASLESIDLNKSEDTRLSAKVEPVAVSRPKTLLPSLSAVFGRKDNSVSNGNIVSKSWADLWDEDEDEEVVEGERLRSSIELDTRDDVSRERAEEEIRSASVPTTTAEHKHSPQRKSARPSPQPIHARPSAFGLDGVDDPESDFAVGQPTHGFMSKSRYSPPLTHFGHDGMYGRERKYLAAHPTWVRPFKFKSRYVPPFGLDGVDERNHSDRTVISKGRSPSPRQDVMDKWAELGKRRRAMDLCLKEAAAVEAGKVGDVGGDGRKGGSNKKPHFYDQTSTEDLEWVGGWHHIENAQLLEKYQLKPNDAILAEEKHLGLYDDLLNNYEAKLIAGGAAQNTARGAQYILPANSVLYIGCVGRDKYADTLREAVRQAGLRVEYRIDDDHPTGRCGVIITGHDRSMCTDLAAANHYKLEHLKQLEIWKLVQQAKVYYVGGYHLTVCVPAVLALAEEAARSDKIFALSLSAPFIPAFFKDQLDQTAPYWDYLIGNETEALSYADSHGLETKDISSIARHLALLPKKNSARPRTVIITQGTDPTIVAISSASSHCAEEGTKDHKEENVTVKSFPVHPIAEEEINDTNGAGDAFAGGFLAGIVQGEPLEKAVDMGQWLAKLSLRELGPSYPFPKKTYTSSSTP